ncbi:unnamed protein product [Chrysoparadoxa australica]
MGKLSCEAVLRGHTEQCWSVDWSPDGQLLASSSSDKVVRVWGRGVDGKEWRCLCELEDGPTRTVRCIAWSPCGRFIAAASFDGTTTAWERCNTADPRHLEFEVIATVEGHENEVKSVCWSKDGSLLATCGRDKTLWIWEVLQDGDFGCVTVLHGHSKDIKQVIWHPTEEMLLSASYDDTIKVWKEDADDWYCTETLEGHTSTVWSIAVDSSGNRLASVSDDCSLRVWKRVDDKWVSVSTLSGYHRRCIYSVDWAQSGHKCIATGAGDDCIRIFQESEYSSPSSDSPSFDLEVTVEEAHEGDVNCVRWNPVDVDLLASVGDDGLVRVWRFIM